MGVMYDYYKNILAKHGDLIIFEQKNGIITLNFFDRILHKLIDKLKQKRAAAIAVYSDDPIINLAVDLYAFYDDITCIPLSVKDPEDKNNIIVSKLAVDVVIADAHVPSFNEDYYAEEFDTGGAGRIYIYEKKKRKVSGEKVTDISLIFHTSGSTGEPKSVCYTQESVLGIIKNSITLVGMEEGVTSTLLFIPLNHIYGRFAILYLFLFTANKIVISNKEQLLEDVKKYNPTFLFGAPAMYKKIYEKLKPKKFFLKVPFLRRKIKNKIFGSSMYRLFSAGASLENKVLTFFKKNFGLTVTSFYGTTECGFIAYNDNIEKYSNSIGRIVPWVKVKYDIVDGQKELLVKTGFGMKHYYKEKETKNRWFNTHDLCEIKKKNTFIVGRADNLIKLSNGTFVVPEYIENLLNDSPYFEQSFIYTKNGEYLEALIITGTKSNKNRITADIKSKSLQHPVLKMIKKVSVVDIELNIENGYLNNNFRLNRKKIFKNLVK